MRFRQWLRYVHTVRHLHPWQVGGRLVARLKRKLRLGRIPVPPTGLTNRLHPAVPFPSHDPWNTRAGLLEGHFRFLNHTADLGQPIDWEATSLPLLWRFNLHYFHFLSLLEPAEQVAFCRAWVRRQPVARGVGWHPYPTSLRIVNWCRAGVEDADLRASLYQQAAYLFRNLETYVEGNHLLENARALVVAGCFFEGQGEAPRWLEKGLALYRNETPRQILADGGHYERSPMYQALLLEGYLDVLNVLPATHPDRPSFVETVRRMSDVLATTTHPDGHLALFNDATQEIALPTEALQGYVQGLTGYRPAFTGSLPDTGYHVFRDAEVYLIVDGGAIGPDHLLAHAHADVFSYELSLQGTPFVVDSGVFEYPPGAMRRYVRSTAAHNTVGIDGLDQVECWHSFRVARRYAPHEVTVQARDGRWHFGGCFDGYAHLVGDDIRHHRALTIDPAARLITVQDTITGSGRHRVESRLHFHPAVVVTPQADRILLYRQGVTCWLEVDPAQLRWEAGWYCPRFGGRDENQVAVLGGARVLPVVLSYRIRY